jgi:hypothetical protein
MIYYVLESPLLPLIVLFACFYGMRFLTQRMQINEFDSIAQLNLNSAFSLSSLASLGVLGYVDSSEMILICSLYLIFYLVVGITSIITINRRILAKQSVGFDVELFADHRHQYVVATVTGILLALTSVFFSYILISKSLSGDDRIALAKDYRVLDLVRRGFATVFTYYSIGCFLYKRDRYLLALVLLNAGIGFFSGAKSFTVEYITAYITINTLIKGTAQVKFKQYAPLLVAVLALTVATVMFWQGLNFGDAVTSLLNRLFASGDIFYYSFIYNDYHDLFGQYNFWSYVFHPITSLIGIRGYEWPIGALLFAQPGIEIQGFGPNPQLPMTALILLQGNFWLSALFCAVMAVLMVFCRNFALDMLERRSLPTVLRTSILAIFFVKPTVILADFGLMMIEIIATVGMTIVTLVFQGILDRREFSIARRLDRIEVLAGKKRAGQKVTLPEPTSLPKPQPQPENTRSKKTDQFEEFVNTTILRNDKLKKLAELLNIKTKL